MREIYEELVSTPGRYEGEHRMVAYIDGNDLYEDTSGDVESSTGWFGRAGRWTVVIDSQGFVSGYKHDSVAEARHEFELEEECYGEWLDEDEID